MNLSKIQQTPLYSSIYTIFNTKIIDSHLFLSLITNLLASIKRTLDYDTIGGLFRDVYLVVHELTVVEKIWKIVMEAAGVVAELTESNSDELTKQIIENDKRLAALRSYAKAA